MTRSTLMELGEVKDGNARFRLAMGPTGDLVLCPPRGQLARGLTELEPAERLRLAAASTERPGLVVEMSDADDGHYVVLVDQPVDLERHVPLGPGDAELLASVNAVARFGRRDDDFVSLTPWNEDDGVVYFTADSPAFANVAIVSLDEDGELQWHRGGAPADADALIRMQLQAAQPPADLQFGVLANPFGECVCIADGTPVLPHEDVRFQALVGLTGLLDGSSTLEEAALRLRNFADRIEAARSAGWRLTHPVNEDLLLGELAP